MKSSFLAFCLKFLRLISKEIESKEDERLLLGVPYVTTSRKIELSSLIHCSFTGSGGEQALGCHFLSQPLATRANGLGRSGLRSRTQLWQAHMPPSPQLQRSVQLQFPKSNIDFKMNSVILDFAQLEYIWTFPTDRSYGFTEEKNPFLMFPLIYRIIDPWVCQTLNFLNIYVIENFT